MAKRILWVVEVREDGVWSPLPWACYPTRKWARVNAAWRKRVEWPDVRVRRYIRED